MLKIFCAQCKEHIYNFLADDLKNIDLFCAAFVKPANKNIKQPEVGEDMRCPLCSKMFIDGKGILTDKGYLPK